MTIILLLAVAIAENRPSRLDKNDVRGKALYEQYCSACHGERALGDGPLAKSIKNVPALAGRFQHEMYPEMIALIQNGRGQMPAYEELIDRTDSKRILIYLRRLDPKTGENLRNRPKASPKIKTEETKVKTEDKSTDVQLDKVTQSTKGPKPLPKNKAKPSPSTKPE